MNEEDQYKSLKDYSQFQTHLTSKDFLTKCMANNLVVIAGLCIFGGVSFAIIGLIMVIMDHGSEESIIKIADWNIETSSVGVACIFLGAVTIVFTVRKLLSVFGKLGK